MCSKTMVKKTKSMEPFRKFRIGKHIVPVSQEPLMYSGLHNSGQKREKGIVSDHPLILGKFLISWKLRNIKDMSIGTRTSSNFHEFEVVSMPNMLEKFWKEERKWRSTLALDKYQNGIWN